MLQRNRRNACDRRGVTLLEVLVIIGITSLLMAMLLPAVQFIRESSRRLQCASQLRQIVAGVNLYHDTYGRYPGNFPGFGWQSRIAPYLEIDPSSKQSTMFRCPSDPEATGPIGAMRSYQLNHGTGVKDGFAGYSQWNSASDVLDGLSQTAAAAERMPAPRTAGEASFSWADFPNAWNRRMRFMPFVGADLSVIVENCRARTNSPPQTPAPEPFYTHVMTPNQNSCSNGSVFTAGTGSIPYAATATSLHSGGVNVSFADGSVHFIADGIDAKVWWAVGRRADGAVGVNF